MSRDYGRVRTQFWSDEKVASWPLDLKCAAVYLLTSPHTTALGAFRLPPAYMCADLNIAPKECAQLLIRLEEAGFIVYCQKTQWVWVRRYLDHNRPENLNVKRHLRALLAAVPRQTRFREALVHAVSLACEGSQTVPDDEIDRSETVSKPFPNPDSTVSEQLIEPNLTEPNLNTPPEALRASPPPKSPKGERWPSEREVPLDWIELGEQEREKFELPPVDLRLEAARFRNYWSSKAGGGATKRDWLATWINWVTSEKVHARSTSSGASRRTEASDRAAILAGLDLARRLDGGPAGAAHPEGGPGGDRQGFRVVAGAGG